MSDFYGEDLRRGVVVVKDGKFWGVQYEDGHSTSYDYGPFKNAKIGDARYAYKPTDFTYQGDTYNGPKLAAGKMMNVLVRTCYTVTERTP